MEILRPSARSTNWKLRLRVESNGFDPNEAFSPPCGRTNSFFATGPAFFMRAPIPACVDTLLISLTLCRILGIEFDVVDRQIACPMQGLALALAYANGELGFDMSFH